MTKAINYFKANPKADKFAFTTDGQAFRNKEVAESHQKSLNGKPGDVKVVTRAQAEKAEKNKDGNTGSGEGSPLDIPEYDDLTKNEIVTLLESHKAELDKKPDAYSKQELYNTLSDVLKFKAGQAK